MRVKSPARDTLEGLVAEELSARFAINLKRRDRAVIATFRYHLSVSG